MAATLHKIAKLHPFQEEILSALKESELETRQQKTYLDTLMRVVIESAPHLLTAAERHLGLDDDTLSIKSKTEERC